MTGCVTFAVAAAFLVREESASDAREDGGADAAADSSLRAECVMQDEREHRGHLVDVEDDDDGGDEEIDARHHGDEQG